MFTQLFAKVVLFIKLTNPRKLLGFKVEEMDRQSTLNNFISREGAKNIMRGRGVPNTYLSPNTYPPPKKNINCYSFLFPPPPNRYCLHIVFYLPPITPNLSPTPKKNKPQPLPFHMPHHLTNFSKKSICITKLRSIS